MQRQVQTRWHRGGTAMAPWCRGPDGRSFSSPPTSPQILDGEWCAACSRLGRKLRQQGAHQTRRSTTVPARRCLDMQSDAQNASNSPHASSQAVSAAACCRRCRAQLTVRAVPVCSVQLCVGLALLHFRTRRHCMRCCWESTAARHRAWPPACVLGSCIAVLAVCVHK